MNTKSLLIWGGLGVVAILTVVLFFVNISYENEYVETDNLILAQGDKCRIIYDKVWKTIAKDGQVAEHKKEAFKEIFVPLMEGRYNGKGKQSPLFLWIQEDNPNYTGNEYDKLMDVIEALQAEYALEQQKGVDYVREQKNLIQKWPGSMFLSDKKPTEFKIITSSKTEDVYETGKDDDINVF